MIKRLRKQKSIFGSTAELETEFSHSDPFAYLASYGGGQGKRVLEPLALNDERIAPLGIRILHDYLAYSIRKTVYIRFTVGGVEENVALFIKELSRKGLRIRAVVESPWLVTDDDKIVPNPTANVGALRIANVDNRPATIGTTASVPSSSVDSSAPKASVVQDNAKVHKSSSESLSKEERSRAAKKAKTSGTSALHDASVQAKPQTGKATSSTNGTTQASTKQKPVIQNQDEEKAERQAEKKRQKNAKARRRAKEKKEDAKQEKEEKDGRKAEFERPAGDSKLAPTNGRSLKHGSDKAGPTTTLSSFAPATAGPAPAEVGNDGHGANASMKEEKHKAKKKKQQHADWAALQKSTGSTIEPKPNNGHAVDYNTEKASHRFGTGSVVTQSGRNVPRQQEPTVKKEDKKRKREEADHDLEPKSRGGNTGTRPTIATAERYGAQASRHSTSMSFVPPTGPAAVQGEGHLEWRSYKQWKGPVPVANSSSQALPERPQHDKGGHRIPPWRNPFDVRPKYRPNSNYFPGAILPKSPDESPAYMVDTVRGVTIEVWSEEAELLPVRYARPYMPRRKEPPTAPYEMPGPAFDATIFDDMFATHARLKQEQAEPVALGKRKRGDKDDGADSSSDSDHDGPHVPRKRPRVPSHTP